MRHFTYSYIASALACSSGAMAIAFTVFVMLTVLLTVFIVLLFALKPFRRFLFRKDYEAGGDEKSEKRDDELDTVETAENAEAVEPYLEPPVAEIIAADYTTEPTEQTATRRTVPMRTDTHTVTRARSRAEYASRTEERARRARRTTDESVSVPTVPLEPVDESDRRSVINDIAAKRRASGNTLDDIRTVEIPPTAPLTAPRRPEQGRFVTTTPRTNRTLDGASIPHTRPAPPRASATRVRTRDKNNSTDDKA